MRILILGATGMLGHKLWQRLGSLYSDCFATLRGARDDYRFCGLFDSDRVIERIDAMDFDAVSRALGEVKPEAIVNCIAVTKRRSEAADPTTAIELNAALPHRLARWAAAHHARLIHFSTDCVFDGRAGNYTEDSPTNAEDLYGRTKALGEVSAPSLTLRTSLVGRELKDKTELLEWFLAQRGRTVRGYRRALYTGVSTNWMADLIAEILRRFPRLQGIQQVAAPTVSKYELLLLARDAFGVDVTVEPDDTFVMLRNLDGSRFASSARIEVPHWTRMMSDLAADPTPYDAWSESRHAT